MDLSAIRINLVKIVRDAGEIAKKYFQNTDLKSESKGGVDFLTNADREVDDFISNKLKEHYPSYDLLTEERATEDYINLHNSQNLFIVDPIDGTTNFSRGDRHYAISVGFVRNGNPLIGIVYLPSEEKLYWAQEDIDHAYCNENIIKTSDISDLKLSSIGLDWAWSMEKRAKTHNWLKKIMSDIRQPRSLGSAASDLCLVAEGKLDGYLTAGVKPWDTAGAVLIVEKAGGIVLEPGGRKYSVFESDILAANPMLTPKILSLIQK